MHSLLRLHMSFKDGGKPYGLLRWIKGSINLQKSLAHDRRCSYRDTCRPSRRRNACVDNRRSTMRPPPPLIYSWIRCGGNFSSLYTVCYWGRPTRRETYLSRLKIPQISNYSATVLHRLEDGRSTAHGFWTSTPTFPSESCFIP